MASVSEEIVARTLTAMVRVRLSISPVWWIRWLLASNPEILEVYNRELTTLHPTWEISFGHVTLKAAYRYRGLVGGTDPVSGREMYSCFGLFRERTTTDQSIETRRFVFIVAGFPGTGLSHEACGERLVKIGKVGLNDGLNWVKRAGILPDEYRMSLLCFGRWPERIKKSLSANFCKGLFMQNKMNVYKVFSVQILIFGNKRKERTEGRVGRKRG